MAWKQIDRYASIFLTEILTIYSIIYYTVFTKHSVLKGDRHSSILYKRRVIFWQYAISDEVLLQSFILQDYTRLGLINARLLRWRSESFTKVKVWLFMHNVNNLLDIICASSFSNFSMFGLSFCKLLCYFEK